MNGFQRAKVDVENNQGSWLGQEWNLPGVPPATRITFGEGLLCTGSPMLHPPLRGICAELQQSIDAI
jgi:hypothetical protein